MPEFGKERLGAQSPEVQQIRTPEIQDVSQRAEVHAPKDVETWLQKVERMAPPTVNDPTTGQAILQPTTVTNQSISAALPVSRGGFIAGFSKSIGEASRWLSTFVWRMIKRNPDLHEFKL